MQEDGQSHLSNQVRIPYFEKKKVIPYNYQPRFFTKKFSNTPKKAPMKAKTHSKKLLVPSLDAAMTAIKEELVKDLAEAVLNLTTKEKALLPRESN